MVFRPFTYDHLTGKYLKFGELYPNVRYVLSADITEKAGPFKGYGLLLPTKNIQIGNLKYRHFILRMRV